MVLAILLFCVCSLKNYAHIYNSKQSVSDRCLETLFCTHLLTSVLRYSQLNALLLCRSLHRTDPKGSRTPDEKRSAASRHVFKIRTHCFLCVYAHRRRHSASVRSAQQRLRTLFKFLPRHRAPSALFYIK